MFKEPPRLKWILLLAKAIREKDRNTLQRIFRTPDPVLQALALEAADCLSGEPGHGDCLGIHASKERVFSTLTVIDALSGSQ